MRALRPRYPRRRLSAPAHNPLAAIHLPLLAHRPSRLTTRAARQQHPPAASTAKRSRGRSASPRRWRDASHKPARHERQPPRTRMQDTAFWPVSGQCPSERAPWHPSDLPSVAASFIASQPRPRSPGPRTRRATQYRRAGRARRRAGHNAHDDTAQGESQATEQRISDDAAPPLLRL